MSLGIHWGLGIGGRTAQGHTGMGGGRCHVHRPRLARTRSGTYLAPPPPKAPTYTAESLCPVVAFPGLSENRGIHNSRGKSHSRAGFSNIRRATWWMGDDNSFFYRRWHYENNNHFLSWTISVRRKIYEYRGIFTRTTPPLGLLPADTSSIETGVIKSLPPANL